MAKIGAIILAAGRGTRFGAPDGDSKLLADLAGKPIVLLVVETALASRAVPVIVVTGHAASHVASVLDGLPVEIVWNPNYRDGMAGSLQAGIAALPEDTDGTFVLLADMPLVEPQTLDAMITRFDEDHQTIDAMVPYFRGKAGNPVLLGRRLFQAVRDLSGDRGARNLIFEPGREVLPVNVDDPGIHVDIDTLEMYVGLGGGT